MHARGVGLLLYGKTFNLRCLISPRAFNGGRLALAVVKSLADTEITYLDPPILWWAHLYQNILL
jgi:hypothetical protein